MTIKNVSLFLFLLTAAVACGKKDEISSNSSSGGNGSLSTPFGNSRLGSPGNGQNGGSRGSDGGSGDLCFSSPKGACLLRGVGACVEYMIQQELPAEARSSCENEGGSFQASCPRNNLVGRCSVVEVESRNGVVYFYYNESGLTTEVFQQFCQQASGKAC